jgi:hypothetical protein
MDDNQLTILRLAAANSVVVPGHVTVQFAISAQDASDRLDQLVASGHLSRHRLLAGAEPCYQITQAGLDTVGSVLPVPELHLARVRHAIGAAYVWLAAHGGEYGKSDWIRSRRELAARGETADADCLVALRGGWLAAHLQTAPPERKWLERALRRYAADPRVSVALFMVENDAVANAIVVAGADLGLSDMTVVQRFTLK